MTEAARLGFTRCVTPHSASTPRGSELPAATPDLSVHLVRTLQEAVHLLLPAPGHISRQERKEAVPQL